VLRSMTDELRERLSDTRAVARENILLRARLEDALATAAAEGLTAETPAVEETAYHIFFIDKVFSNPPKKTGLPRKSKTGTSLPPGKLSAPGKLSGVGVGLGSCQGVLSGRSFFLFFSCKFPGGKLSGGPVRPKLSGVNFPGGVMSQSDSVLDA